MKKPPGRDAETRCSSYYPYRENELPGLPDG